MVKLNSQILPFCTAWNVIKGYGIGSRVISLELYPIQEHHGMKWNFMQSNAHKLHNRPSIWHTTIHHPTIYWLPCTMYYVDFLLLFVVDGHKDRTEVRIPLRVWAAGVDGFWGHWLDGFCFLIKISNLLYVEWIQKRNRANIINNEFTLWVIPWGMLYVD